MDDTSERCSTHLKCPECGYNLFVLPAAADDVRCPECGQSGDIRDRRAAIRTKRVRESLILIVLCLTTMVLMLVSVTACYLHRTPVTMLLAGVSVAACLASELWFQQRHKDIAGMGAALLMFHGSTFVLPTGVAVLIWGTSELTEIENWHSRGVFGGIAMGLLILWFGRWLVREAYGRLHDAHDLHLR